MAALGRPAFRPIDSIRRARQHGPMSTANLHRQDSLEADSLLTQKDLAARWRCSLSYIQKCDLAYLPPRCTVLPGQIRYRLSDVLLFEASRVDRTHPLFALANVSREASPQPRAGRPARPPASHPGFPIRLPEMANPRPRRGGRKPRPAIIEGESA